MSARPSITVFGAGYVGLVTAACLAELGQDVVCVERDPQRLAALRERGAPSFHEPGLAPLIRRNTARDRLRFEADGRDAIAAGGILYIAVGTPAAADGAADLSQVHD